MVRGLSGEGDCPMVLQPPLRLESLLFHPSGISVTAPSGLGDPAVTGPHIWRTACAAGHKQPADPWALAGATNNSAPCGAQGAFFDEV